MDAHLTVYANVSRDGLFFFRLAAFLCGIVLLGFAPTYWMQIAAGTGHFPVIIHAHAASSTAWLTLLAVQSWFVANGHLQRHKIWGLVGISLATLLVTLGFIAAVAMLKLQLAQGHGDSDRAFEIIIQSQLVGFSGLFIAAMANCFMICAALQLASVGVARMFFLARWGIQPGLWPGVIPYPPVTAHIPVTLVLGSIIVFAMARDRRVDGSVHPAWEWGLIISLGIGFLRIPLANTTAWFAVANWLAGF